MSTCSRLPVFLLVLLLLGCGGLAKPGSVAMSLKWDDPPTEPVWVWVQVEERIDPLVAGPILASASPAEYSQSKPFSVELEQIPNGDNRVIVVEVREANNSSLAVLYYGVSEPFSMRPGEDVVVEIPLSLQKPESEHAMAEAKLLLGDAQVDSVGPLDVTAMTVRTRSVGAVSVVLANDAGFSANLTTVPLESAEGVVCTEEDHGEQSVITCDIPWDLAAGLPEVSDGFLTLYARFVDRYAYESQVHKASVLYDSTPPQLITSSLSPPVARVGQEVVISVNFHETMAPGGDGAALDITPSLPESMHFKGPVQVGKSNSYVWTALVPAMDEEGLNVYTFQVTATDALGNLSDAQQLANLDGDPLELKLDALAPVLEPSLVTPIEKVLFGLEEYAPGGDNALHFDFVVVESLPVPRQSEAGPCEGDCPVVTVGGKAVGQVTREPELDNAQLQRLGFSYLYDVTSQDWGLVDKEVEISIDWTDVAGNNMAATLDQQVRFDFVRPEAVDCILTPQLANQKSTLSYTISVSEKLTAPPELILPEGFEEFPEEPLVAGGGLSFTWQASAAHLDITELALAATLEDLAGNHSAGEVCSKSIALDTSKPILSQEKVETDPQVLNSLGSVVVAAGPEDRVIASFTVSDDQSLAPGYPEVVLNADSQTVELVLTGETVLSEAPPATTYTFELLLDPQLHSEAEGTWPIEVTIADLAGNIVVEPVLAGQKVHVDFQPPTADCSLIPAPPAEGYAAGNKVTLVVSPFEELEPGYIPKVDEDVHPTLEQPLLAYETGSSYRFAGLVPDSGATHTFELDVALRDLVGNQSPPGSSACSAPVSATFDAELPLVSFAELKTGAPGFDDEPDGIYAAGTAFGLELHLAGTEEKPQASLGGGEMNASSELPLEVVNGESRWWMTRILDGTEAEGAQSVSVWGYDEAGNPYAYDLAWLVAELDFTPPNASCFAAPSPAAAGEIVELTVAVSELLGEVPFVDSDLAFGDGETDDDGLTWHFTYPVPFQGEDVFEWHYAVTMTDVAGNQKVDACKGAGTVDPVPPVVEGGEDGIVVSSTHVREGQQFTVEFSLKDAGDLDGDPVVKVGPRFLDIAPELSDPGYAFVYTPTTTGNSPDQEGIWPIMVTLTDLAGNQSFYSPATVTFDFTKPTLLAQAELNLSPPSGCPLAQVQNLGPEATLEVSFSVDDFVAFTPSLTFEGQGVSGVAIPNVDEHNPYRTTFTYRFVEGTDGNLPDGMYETSQLLLNLEDLAGNTAQITLGQVVLDTLPPTFPDTWTDKSIVYTRIPWGSDATGGAKSYFLRGAAGAMEPDSWALVYDGTDPAQSQLIGIVQTSSDGAFGGEPGSPQTFSLAPPDRPQVYVASVDNACNFCSSGDSPVALAVVDTEWIQTMGFRKPGDNFTNTNVFEERAWFTDRFFQEDAVEPQEPDLLGTSDGGSVLSGGAGSWDERKLSYYSPMKRSAGAMVWDPVQERLLLFGGLASTLTNELWAYDGLSWHELSSTDPELDGNPGPRDYHAIAFDTHRNRLVTFGGTTADTFGSRDLWEWDGHSWARTRPAGSDAPGPVERHGMAMTYDTQNELTLLFSGHAQGNTGYRDLWGWDGSGWTNLWAGQEGQEYVDGPPQLFGAAAAYDRDKEIFYVYGGSTNSADKFKTAQSTLWAWTNGQWTIASDDGDDPSPPALASPAAASLNGKLYLFGGRDTGPEQQTLWEWDGEAWTELWPAGGSADDGPVGRWLTHLAADPGGNRLYLFGGARDPSNQDRLDDFWEWNCQTQQWQEVELPSADSEHWPPVGNLLASVFEPVTRIAWYRGDFAPVPSIWGWDGRRWFEKIATDNAGDGTPSVYAEGDCVYDTGNGRVLCFLSKDVQASPLDGLWEWTDGEWDLLSPADPDNLMSPSGRLFHAMAWDENRDRLVLFGGRAAEQWPQVQDTLGDLWEWDGQEWEKVHGAEPDNADQPVPRVRGNMVYDRARQRILMVDGGTTQGDLLNQNERFWEWDGTQWYRKEWPAEASPPYNHWSSYRSYAVASLFYDDVRNKIVNVALRYASPHSAEEIWEWDGTGWSMAPVADPTDDGSAEPNFGREAVYDPLRREALVFGGSTVTYSKTSEFWRWRSGHDQRPGQVLRVALDVAGITPETVQSLELVWHAGGDSTLEAAAHTGAELLTYSGGKWEPLTQNSASSTAPTALTFESTDPAAWFYGTRPYLSFAVRPLGFNGTGYATVASSYVELSVDYRIPPTPVPCLDETGDTAEGSTTLNSYACLSGDYSAPEVSYLFQPACNGQATVTLKKAPDVVGFLDLAVMDGSMGCPGDTCLHGQLMGSDTATLTFDINANTSYCLVIDGYNGAAGPFTLTAECSCQ